MSYTVNQWPGGDIGEFASKKRAEEFAKRLREANRQAGNSGYKVRVVKVSTKRNPVKRHKRSSITLRNMKSVTIKRKADGTVEVRGTRKKARKR